MPRTIDEAKATDDILDQMRREADALLAELDELAREISEARGPWEVPAFDPAAYASTGVICA